MAFSGFRYHPNADAGLVELLVLGNDVFERLIQKIRHVQSEWEPEDLENPVFVVPFSGFLLTFTVAQEDRSVLILAAVDRQPQA